MSDSFNTKNEFAKKYDTWRRKEELQKLKDKYGNDLEEPEESSSSSDSDSDDPTLTDPKLQEDWLKTLTALKTKDPRIYQKDYRFFEDPEEESSSEDSEDGSKPKKKKQKKEKKEKPMYLKDYQRKVILEKGGIISSDEEEFDLEEKSTGVVTYHDEQEEIRQSFVKAAENLVDNEEDDDLAGGLLVKRKRTVQEEEEEQKELTEWKNKQEEGKNKKERKDFGIEAEPINTWDLPNLNEKERFLKNFILGQAYREKDSKRIPTYDEVVYGDEDDEEAFRQEGEFLEKAEKFEKRHNFRFEEYGGSEVKSYPRAIDNLVRRKDTKRAEQRNAIKERKQQEKDKKKEELKRLKNLKRQEIQSKLEKLKAVTGNESVGFNADELEEDFDPNKHDEMMQKYFDDDYYAVGTDEVQKPVFEMSDDEGNWDNWGGGAGTSGHHGDEGEGPYADDPDFCMDADYDPSMKRESRKKQKRKKNKQKLGEALEKEKPVFDPNEKTFEEYIDEYYNLDFEDIIDDIPCRFKYRKVTPNNFGLTTDEILKCHDKELNAWVSVKKLCQYRTEDEEQYDIKAFNLKAKNENVKKRVLYSLFDREQDKQDDDDDEVAEKPDDDQASPSKKKRKRRNRKKKDKLPQNADVSESEVKNAKQDEVLVKSDRLESDGDVLRATEESVDDTSQSEDRKKKKKKKKKREGGESEQGENFVSSESNTEKCVNEHTATTTDKNNGETVSKKKDKKKRRKDGVNTSVPQKQGKLSNARLRAYGINPRQFKTPSQEKLQYKHAKN